MVNINGITTFSVNPAKHSGDDNWCIVMCVSNGIIEKSNTMRRFPGLDVAVILRLRHFLISALSIGFVFDDTSFLHVYLSSYCN